MKQTFFLKKKNRIHNYGLIHWTEWVYKWHGVGLVTKWSSHHVLHWKDILERLDLYRLSAKFFMGERTESNLRAAEVMLSIKPTCCSQVILAAQYVCLQIWLFSLNGINLFHVCIIYKGSCYCSLPTFIVTVSHS